MGQGDAQAPTGATVNGENLLGAAAPGGAISGPTNYPFWQVSTDLWNLGEAASTGQVLWKRGETTYPNTADWKDTSFSGQLSSVNKAINPVPVKGPDQVNSMRDAVAELYKYPPDKLADIQNRMYTAGFYPPQSYAKGASLPNGKVVDDYTRAAAINLFSTVVGYQGQKSVGEVLDDFTKAGVGQQKLKDATSQKQGTVYNITTDDPATLRASVVKVSQGLLGRALSDEETNALVNQMLTQEKAPQEAAVRAGQTADTGSDVTLATARVDANARIKEAMEAKNPAEAGAYEQLNYYDVLRQMMGGPQQ